MSGKLREAAELFMKLSRDAGRELEFDDAGVAWADQYVEAVRPVETEDQLRVHTALVGAYLGEALIASHGGAWVDDDGEWAVDLGDGTRLHPFRRTMAHLKDGADSSILALFRTAGGDGGEDADPAPLLETGERFREVIQGNGGPADYGEAMVAFVADFVDSARPVDDELLDQYTTMVGAVLGQSIIAAYGGAWSRASGAWAIRFDPLNELYPFAEARKHLENGAGDSIADLFRAIPRLFAAVLRRSGREP